MSAIRKTPYIETVLASLNAEQFAALKTAINSAADGTDGNYSFLPGGTNIPALTEEVTYNIECATIQLGRDKQRNGILVHTSNYCVFLVYGESQKITIYNLNRTNKTYSLVEEYCDIEELRRVLNDGEEAAGDAWVEVMKTKMVYDEDNNEVEIGTHLYVDGKLEVGDTGGGAGDVVIGHELIIDDLQKIVDTNGDAFIPDPSGHLNESLVHYTSGYTWKKGYELSGFQVVAKSVFENDFTYQTHIVYFVWNDTAGDHYGEVYVRYYEA